MTKPKPSKPAPRAPPNESSTCTTKPKPSVSNSCPHNHLQPVTQEYLKPAWRVRSPEVTRPGTRHSQSAGRREEKKTYPKRCRRATRQDERKTSNNPTTPLSGSATPAQYDTPS